MSTWIAVCKLTKYDAEGAFSEHQIIDWKQSTNVEAGDIVYIYISKPVGGIRFKCRANKVNLPERNTDDGKWVVDGSQYERYGRYMELELLHRFETVIPTLEDMQARGIKAIMGPLTVNPDALEFLQQCEIEDGQASKINREEITENIAIIKINKMYKESMSALELYEATRGVWKRKLESVLPCEYCLSVAYSKVVEVYKIDNWYPAGSISMQTRKIDSNHLKRRVEFSGEVAREDIRRKYIGRSVADLYKLGEADPVKTFINDNSMQNQLSDINTALAPFKVISVQGETRFICPNCEEEFLMAPRCPVCGQLIAY